MGTELMFIQHRWSIGRARKGYRSGAYTFLRNQHQMRMPTTPSIAHQLVLALLLAQPFAVAAAARPRPLFPSPVPCRGSFCDPAFEEAALQVRAQGSAGRVPNGGFDPL